MAFEGPDIRFLADDMVGKLARLLRMAGYDTSYYHDIDDDEMLRVAGREGRIILTRHQGLLEKHPQVEVVILESERPMEQFLHVAQAFNLQFGEQVLKRCLECNQPLREVDKQGYKEAIPPYVFRTQDKFYRCQSCGRLYWAGTHYRAMQRKLEEIRRRLGG